MTERAHDDENQSGTHGRPEGQDASDTMNDSTNDTTERPAGPAGPTTDPTEVLPPVTATPPTQEIAQATQRIPEGAAPEGEVHPAYGAAAARVQAEADATAVHDAPVDDTDLLAPLRDPEPARDPQPVPVTSGATAPASGPGTTGHAPGAGTHGVGHVPGEATHAPGHTPGHASGAATHGGTLPQPAPVGAAAGAQADAAAAQAGAANAAAPAQPGQPAVRRGPRVGTAVWGLIVIAIGLGILAVSAGVVFDLGAALIVLLGAAGVILVVGSVVSSVRRR